MKQKFSQGDRVTVCDDTVAAQLGTASRDGTIVQGEPDDGSGGSFQVMFDGETLPQWVKGVSLAPAGGDGGSRV